MLWVRLLRVVYQNLKLVLLTFLFILNPFYSLQSYIRNLLSGIEFELENPPDLTNKNFVIISNHLSWYDFFVIRFFLFNQGSSHFCTGLRKSGFGYWLYAKALARRGDLYFSNKDKTCIDKNIKLVKQGYHSLLFPEGTRNRTKLQLQAFKRGVERVILGTEKEVLLVYLKGTNKVLKGEMRVSLKFRIMSPAQIKDGGLEKVYRESFAIT